MLSTEAVADRHAVERALRSGDPATLRAAGEAFLGVDSTLGAMAGRVREAARLAMPALRRSGPAAVRVSLLVGNLADAMDRLALPLRGQGRTLHRAADALSKAQRDLVEFQRDVSGYELNMRAIGVACDYFSIDREAAKILQALGAAYQHAITELRCVPAAGAAVADVRLATAWVSAPLDRMPVPRPIPPVSAQSARVPSTAKVSGGKQHGRVDG